MNIYFNDESLISNDLKEKIYDSAKACFAEEKIEMDKLEISISFVSNEEIKELNEQYRNKNSVTDVLSFPQFEDISHINFNEPYVCLGDVVISLDKAIQQAKELGHSEEREIIYLIVHSILHLLGYDHMNAEEKRLMREKEELVMKRIQLERFNHK